MEKTKTLHQLIGGFLDSRRNLSPATLNFYRIILSHVSWYGQNHSWPEPGLITKDHLRDFLNYVATESYRWPEQQRCSYKKASPATVHHYGRVLKTLFNWAEDEEYLDTNPSLKLRLGLPGYRQVEPYSDDEVRAMLGVCQADVSFGYRFLGIRNRAIICLFADTGLRLSELGGIRLSDLDPRLNQLRVMGKGAKARVVPVNGEAKKALRQYLGIRPQGGDELWQTGDGRPMVTSSIKVMIQRLKKRAGINGGGGPHRLRHYFATRYLEAGGNLNSLRLLLGHSTLNMVLRYSRYVDTSRALSEHQRFSPLDRLCRGQNHSGDGWGWRY